MPGCMDKQVKQTVHFQLISGIEKQSAKTHWIKKLLQPTPTA